MSQSHLGLFVHECSLETVSRRVLETSRVSWSRLGLGLQRLDYIPAMALVFTDLRTYFSTQADTGRNDEELVRNIDEVRTEKPSRTYFCIYLRPSN